MTEPQADHMDLVALTVDIVGAYVSNNHVQSSEVPRLIADVHAALAGLGSASAGVEEPRAKATPAEIRRSVTPEHLVSFEDGKQYKTLRRHLTLRGLSPEQYRAKWGLPSDYPMTSAMYSEQRSKLAIDLGLGQQRRKRPEAAPVEAASVVEVETPAASTSTRGRSRKNA